MTFVLAAIVLTVFAGLFVPPFLFPPHNVYQTSVTSDSPYGFVLHLSLNATSLASGESLLLTGWLNSTSSLENVTVASQWAVPRSNLYGPFCNPGWPIGLGVMQGHYTQDNYTLGSLRLISAAANCPEEDQQAPTYFVTEDHSSTVLSSMVGEPAVWDLHTHLAVSPDSVGPMPSGVYTAVFADEWGDILTTIFQVSQP